MNRYIARSCASGDFDSRDNTAGGKLKLLWGELHATHKAKQLQTVCESHLYKPVIRKCCLICGVCEIIQYLVLTIVHCYSCI